MPSVSQELLTAANYALLAYAGISNTGSTVVGGGNIGSFPTASITGFPPGVVAPPYGIVNGPAANQARIDGNNALLYYQGLGPGTVLTNADMGTQNVGSGNGVYPPGVYSSATSLAITTAITLSGSGLYVFLAASTITQAIAGTITLANGATANNVIWVPGSSWTSIGPGGLTQGNILAFTSVTLGGGVLNGRALAVGGGNGAVTVSASEIISAPAVGTLPATPGAPGTNGSSLNCLISRNLGSSVLTAWPQPTSQTGLFPKLDLIQIFDQGGACVLNVDYTGTVNYPAVNPTNGVRIGVFFTRLNPLTTSVSLAALSLDTWTNNPAQEDIIQVINLGGAISYWIDYVLVAHGS